jgi:hypothetical protein
MVPYRDGISVPEKLVINITQNILGYQWWEEQVDMLAVNELQFLVPVGHYSTPNPKSPTNQQ